METSETNIFSKGFAEAISSGEPIDAVIHFAGLKAVGESVQKPLCIGTTMLLDLETYFLLWRQIHVEQLFSAVVPQCMATQKQFRFLNQHPKSN